MKISIIIPTLNEADNISLLIPHLLQNAREKANLEIIVSDGDSEDKTVDVANSFGVKTVLTSKRNRAIHPSSSVRASLTVPSFSTLYAAV